MMLIFPDQDREWSLDGAQTPRKAMDAKYLAVKQCPACYAVVFQTEKFCSYCGVVFEGKERSVTEVDGELVEVDHKAAIKEQQKLKKRQTGQARSYKELVELGKAHGYKKPYEWARHVMKYGGRQEEENRRKVVAEAGQRMGTA